MTYHFLSRSVFHRIMEKYNGLRPKCLTPDEQCKISVVLYNQHHPSVFTENAIQNAAKFDNINVLKYLYYIGIIDQYDCKWALKFAASNGCLNAIKYLINCGKEADNNIFNAAVIRGNITIMKYLIDIGIKPECEAYLYMPDIDYEKIIEFLFYHNVIISIQLLEYLVFNNKCYIIETMRSHGFKMSDDIYINLLVLAKNANINGSEQYLLRNYDVLV